MQTLLSPRREPVPIVQGPPAPDPGWPVLTAAARKLLVLVAILFALSVAFRLNGSSVSYAHFAQWQDVRLRDTPTGLLLSEPKAARTDEWLVCTLATLSQARAQPSFPTTNLSYGPGRVPLLMSLPARHYTLLFRPTLWAYFILPFDYAFSWHWNLKVFGLFASLFLLFWVLTGGSFAHTLAGATIVQFSGYTQWWFSSPAMLPEMLTAWALGTVAALSLFVRTEPRARMIATGILSVSVVNFFLCCYPPYEIPLFYLAACLVAGYVWQHQLPVKIPGILLVASSLAAALLLVPWFLDCRDTLAVVAQTLYPGQRKTLGGGLLLARLFSGLFTFDLDETNVPAKLGNICEAANFYPLWWLPLGLGVVSLGRSIIGSLRPFAPVRTAAGSQPFLEGSDLARWLRARGLRVGLATFIGLFTLYTLAPLPGWFCSATLLSRCTEPRCLLPLGVGGIMYLILDHVSRSRGRRWRRGDAVALAGWSMGALVILLCCRAQLPGYLTFWHLTTALGAAIFLAAVYLWGGRLALPCALPVLLVLKTALINPLCVGLPELLDSPTLHRISQIVQTDRSAGWVAYESVFGPELIKACGGRVLNGLRVVPDLPAARRLDPTGANEFDYNRYVHLLFFPPLGPGAPTIQLLNDVYCKVGISPAAAARLYPELKYILCTRPVPDPARAGVTLVEGMADSHVWIYQIKPPQVPAP